MEGTTETRLDPLNFPTWNWRSLACGVISAPACPTVSGAHLSCLDQALKYCLAPRGEARLMIISPSYK